MFNFIKNILKKIKSWFTLKPKDEKLYKFTYRDGSYAANDRVLLVTAENPAAAVRELYRLTNDKVSDIREFTEIKYGSMNEEESGDQL